jgi:hypothetical protein
MYHPVLIHPSMKYLTSRIVVDRMRGRGKTRTGLILVTLSSFCIILTVILLLSGFRYSDQVLYTEDDFLEEGENFILEFRNDLPGVFTYSIDSGNDLRISLRLKNAGGNTIHRDSGEVPLTGQITLERTGDHVIELELLSGNGSLDDLDIEIGSTGESIILTCCVVSFLGLLSFIFLLTGAMLTVIGAREARD